MSSITQHARYAADTGHRRDLRKMLESIQTDLANLRAAIVAINAKLDLDGGVTGTDFASTTNPAALNTTA